jgi:hypothetical protein
LVSNILFHHFERSAAHGAYEITIGPQTPLAAKMRVSSSQKERRATLEETNQPMDAKLRLYLDQYVDMIRHGLNLDEVSAKFFSYALQDGLEILLNSPTHDTSPVFWAPDNVVLARVDHIPVRAIGTPAHHEHMYRLGG